MCDWVLPIVIDGIDHAVTGGSLRQAWNHRKVVNQHSNYSSYYLLNMTVKYRNNVRLQVNILNPCLTTKTLFHSWLVQISKKFTVIWRVFKFQNNSLQVMYFLSTIVCVTWFVLYIQGGQKDHFEHLPTDLLLPKQLHINTASKIQSQKLRKLEKTSLLKAGANLLKWTRVMSKNICEACGQVLPEGKNFSGTSEKQLKLNQIQDCSSFIYKLMLYSYIKSFSYNW